MFEVRKALHKGRALTTATLHVTAVSNLRWQWGGVLLTHYRPDIDGLRAVAVLAVVLFHAGVPLFSGGYVGVDVFFVISGYLITSIIHEEIRDGRFSLAAFYERRIRRIFPALFVVIASTAVAAALVSLPADFKSIGRSIIAATLFASNLLFASQDGYFDAPAETNPLLHTWSLAVEEQFYILFPLLLLAASRLIRGRLVPTIAAIAGLSFVAGLWGVRADPTAAFYLPHTRAWELLLGALIALRAVPPVHARWLRDCLSALGLGLIACAIVMLTEESRFPGEFALLPCLGAAAIIHAGSSGSSLAGRLLGARPAVVVGKLSYSLYLWHWPLIVFSRYYLMRELRPEEVAGVLALSFAAAYLSFRFIEQPFRRAAFTVARRRAFHAGASAMAIFATVGAIAYATDGWATRFPDLQREIPGRAYYREGTCFLRKDQQPSEWAGEACFLTHGWPTNTLLWGDSYAAHYVPGLNSASDRLRTNLLQYTSGGCQPLYGYAPSYPPHCAAFNQGIDRILTDYNIKTVILATRWATRIEGEKSIFEELAGTVDYLESRGVNAIVIGQSPGFPFTDPRQFLARNGLPASAEGVYSAPLAVDPGINQKLRASAPSALFIDPMAPLCTGPECLFFEHGEYLVWDAGHLSRYGSEKLATLIAGALANVGGSVGEGS